MRIFSNNFALIHHIQKRLENDSNYIFALRYTRENEND